MATERQELEKEIGRSLATQLLRRRDQLDQQVEALLAEIQKHRGKASIYCNKCGYFGPPSPDGHHRGCDYLAGFAANDNDLYAAADQVRKERGT